MTSQDNNTTPTSNPRPSEKGFDNRWYLRVKEYSPTLLTLEIAEGFGSIPAGDYWLRHSAKDVGVSVQGVARPGNTFDPDYAGEAIVLSIDARPIVGGEIENKQYDYEIQVFSVEWSDGKHGNADCRIVPIVPVGGHPRKTFKDGGDLLEEAEDFDRHATLKERRADARGARADALIEGLYHSGYDWDSTNLPPVESVPNTYLNRGTHPEYGIFYTFTLGNSYHLLAPRPLLEACWLAYAEKHKITPERSVKWLRDPVIGPFVWSGKTERNYKTGQDEPFGGCAGHEFHEWNAARGGYAVGGFVKVGTTYSWQTQQTLEA